jgi:hypothetical protein
MRARVSLKRIREEEEEQDKKEQPPHKDRKFRN